MKKHVLMFAMMLIGAGAAIAACPGNGYLSGAQGRALLTGLTACSPANCSGANCQWQENHQAGGSLVEQHAGTVADPAETVGRWRIAGNTGVITHDYGTGGSFDYSVNDNGAGNYSFCGANVEFTFSVKAGRC